MWGAPSLGGPSPSCPGLVLVTALLPAAGGAGDPRAPFAPALLVPRDPRAGEL